MRSRRSASTSILALAFVASGCSSLPELSTVSRERLTNGQGHVIGHRELVRDKASDRVVVRVARYTPRLDEQGRVIGYEEPTAGGGAYLRDLQGVRVGVRHIDLRSSATNPHSRGLTIVLRPREPERLTLVKRPEARP
jgi:hypothetical protein